MADERVIPGTTGLENIQKHFLRYVFALKYCRQQYVLDAACGTGYGSLILSTEARRVIGWDNDQEAIEFARSTYARKNMSLEINDITNTRPLSYVGLPEGSLFDVVVSFETLEHLSDPQKALAFFTSITTPEGVILASVPLNEPEGFNEHHKHRYTIDQAQQLFSSNPKTIVEDIHIQRGLSIAPLSLLPKEATSFPYTYALFVLRVATD